LDYKHLIGKKVEVIRIHRKRKIRHVGRLTDISGNYICLQTKWNKDVWVTKPSYKNGYIKEVNELDELI